AKNVTFARFAKGERLTKRELYLTPLHNYTSTSEKRPRSAKPFRGAFSLSFQIHRTRFLLLPDMAPLPADSAILYASPPSSRRRGSRSYGRSRLIRCRCDPAGSCAALGPQSPDALPLQGISAPPLRTKKTQKVIWCHLLRPSLSINPKLVL